jgi:hypothetical protein
MQIRKWLTGMGMARGEEMGDLALLGYSKALEVYPDECISAVLGRLSTSKRAEYESKIPELGGLLDMVRSELRRRHPWVACGCCSNGWVLTAVGCDRVASRCQCWKDWRSSAPAIL